MDKEYTPVEIPTDLYKQIEEKIKTSNMSSVTDFITALLKDSLSSGQTHNEADSLSREDEEKVKERLKALGYMD